MLFLAAVFTPAVAAAATFSVTTTADSNSGTCVPGSCTLRQAVLAANASPGSVIEIPAGHYSLSFGELELLANVTIGGAGPAATTIAQGGPGRIFNIPSAAVTAGIDGVGIEGGIVSGTSATPARGGGVRNLGTLTLNDVVVRNNVVRPADNTGTSPEGGGIYNAGVLHITDSLIEGNRATSLPFAGGIPSGAGIDNQGGQVDLTDSALSRNSAINENGIAAGGGLNSTAATAHGAGVRLTRVSLDGNRAVNLGTGGIPEGGGIYAFRTDLTILDSAITRSEAIGGAIADGAGIDFLREGNFILERSLVAENVAESKVLTDGAGLFINGEATEVQRIVNSTITANRGVSPVGNTGAGIFHFGGAHMEVVSSTISGNVTEGSGGGDGGGNLNDAGTSGSVLTLRDSIVSGGKATAGSENCSGAGVQSAGHNIDSLDQCNFHAAGDKVNTDPLLAALASNGGPTETMALHPGSPAIDAGDACPATDQRGIARPQGGGCDIGAFELVPPVVTAPPPAQKAPLPPSGRADFKLLSRTVTISLKTGAGSVSSRCLNVAGDRCQVTLTLTAAAPTPGGRARAKVGPRVGTATATLAGGSTGKLRIKMTSKGLALLQAAKKHKLQVTAAGKSTNNANQAVAVKQTLTLKGKAPKGS